MWAGARASPALRNAVWAGCLPVAGVPATCARGYFISAFNLPLIEIATSRNH